MSGLSVTVQAASGEVRKVNAALDAQTGIVQGLLVEVANTFGLASYDTHLIKDTHMLKPGELLRDAGVRNGSRLQLIVSRSRLAVTASMDGSAKTWDLETGDCRQTFSGHGEGVNSACFSPDGTLVLTAAGAKLRLWDVLRDECSMALQPHGQKINAAIFSPSGREIISASDDGTVKIMCSRTGRGVGSFKHGSAVVAVACSPDGCTLASACRDGTVRLWRIDCGECLQILPAAPYRKGLEAPPCFSSDGSVLLFLANDYEACLHSVATGDLVQSFRAPYGGLVPEQYDMTIFAATGISPDNRLVFTVSLNGDLRIWSRRSGECIQKISTGSTGRFMWASFSEDSCQVLASCSNAVKLWDVKTGKCEQVLEGHKEAVAAGSLLGLRLPKKPSSSRLLRSHL